jgi:hypothetical protein
MLNRLARQYTARPNTKFDRWKCAIDAKSLVPYRQRSGCRNVRTPVGAERCGYGDLQ